MAWPLKKLLDEKEKEINTQQDSFRKLFEDASRQMEVYKKQARTFPPPARWRAYRWREMVPPDNIHLK